MRVMSVWAVLLAIVCVSVGALFVPSYVLIESERKALETERMALADKSENISTIETEVRNTNELARALKDAGVPQMMAPLIVAIYDAALPGIEVRAYELRREEGVIKAIYITGVASTRSALIAFQKSLKANPNFEDAEVPIEDLVRERELPFRITVTVVTNEP